MTSIAVRPWFVMLVLIQLNIAYGSDLRSFEPGFGMTVDDDVEVCPHHESCQDRCGSPSNSKASCYCDSNCELYGDCCYDYWTSCTDIDILNSSIALRNLSTCVNNGDSFYLISKCSPGTVDEELRFKCENPNPDDLFLKIPVSDDINLAYANVFCALCNGVAILNVKAWELTANCRYDNDDWWLSSMSVSSQLDQPITEDNPNRILSEMKQAEYCDYVFNPIRNDYKRYCGEHEVKECPPDYPDKKIEHYCRMYTAIVYVDNVRYANPHCAQCHGKMNHSCSKKRVKPTGKMSKDPVGSFDVPMAQYPAIEDQSRDSSISDRISYSGEIFFDDELPGLVSRVVPITILIDFSSGGLSVKTPSKRTTTKILDCGSGRVFDPFKEECINILCEHGKILTKYGCIERMQPLKQVPMTKIPGQVIELICICSSTSHVQIQYWFLNDSVIANDSLAEMTLLVEEYNASSVDIQHLDSLNVLISFQTSECHLLHKVFSLIFYQSHTTAKDFLKNVSMIQTCGNGKTMLPAGEECMSQTFDVDKLNIFQTDVIEITDGLNNFTIAEHSYRVDLAFNVKNETTVSSLKLMNCLVEGYQCPLIGLSINEFYFTNTTWVHYNSGRRFSMDDIIIISNDTLYVCSFFFKNGTIQTPNIIFVYEETLQLINLVGVSCSLVSLFLTCIIIFAGKELRTTSGKIVMNIAISLFFAQFGTLFAGTLVEFKHVCTAIAALLHYLWLVSFMCMFVMSLTLFKSFRSFRSSLKSRRYQPIKLHLCCSWVIPFVYIAILATVHFSDRVPFQFSYGDDTVCWIRDEFAALIFFGIPSATILAVNSFLFLVIIYGIHRSKKNSRKVRGSTKRRDITSNIIIYTKISCIMGLTWTTGCLASIIDQPFVWYIFVVLNSLQGVFIFISFSAKRLMRLLQKKQKKISNGSPTRTGFIQESCKL